MILKRFPFCRTEEASWIRGETSSRSLKHVLLPSFDLLYLKMTQMNEKLRRL